MSYRIWIRTVERQHRIRLPEDAVAAIPWLTAGKSKECAAFVGSLGQLQIAPVLIESQLAQQFTAVLAQNPARPNDASADWIEFVRYAATQWKVEFAHEAERKRMTLVLPKEARDLGIAPSEGTSAVLFATGEVVEVWKAQDWVAHIRLIRQRMDELVLRASDELTERQT